MFQNKRVGVVIPAAGEGFRVGGVVKKQFLKIAGRPLWIHTVEKFCQCPEVDYIVVAGPGDAIGEMKQQALDFGLSKSLTIVSGGVHRQDSVHLALDKLKMFSPELVLVHDAVRPFVSHEIIFNVLDAALEFGAAIPVVRPKETIKTSNGDSFVDATPDRDTLVVVQTPQGFSASVLYDAFDRAANEKFYGTDESSLVERLGVKVKLINGDYANTKITTPDDIRIGEILLSNKALGTHS